MASITLNGQSVALIQQKQEAFAQAAYIALPRLHEMTLPSVLAAVIADGIKQNAPTEHPLVQTALWMLHEMGVRNLEVDPEKSQVTIKEHIPADQMARDRNDPFTPGNIATGRAMAVALNNHAQRKFTMNGETLVIRARTLEDMKKTIAAISQLRRVNEDHVAATARYVGGLVRTKREKDDPALGCAINLLSDFGICGIRVDTESGSITIEGLNEVDAQCGAYLQGGNPDQIRASRERVRAIAAQAKAMPAREAPTAPSAANAAPTEPQFAATQVTLKRRRRE